MRKQLEKLQLDTARFLEGRRLEDLNADEVYGLAKVLPDLTQEKRHEADKGVVHAALAAGYVNSVNSLDVLQQMRRELDISDNEHQKVLEELGIEDPRVRARKSALIITTTTSELLWLSLRSDQGLRQDLVAELKLLPLTILRLGQALSQSI